MKFISLEGNQLWTRCSPEKVRFLLPCLQYCHFRSVLDVAIVKYTDFSGEGSFSQSCATRSRGLKGGRFGVTTSRRVRLQRGAQ